MVRAGDALAAIAVVPSTRRDARWRQTLWKLRTRPSLAAHGQDRLVQEVESLEVALRQDVAHVADELPGLPEDGLLLELEEFGIPVNPAGQAEIVLSAEVGGGSLSA